MEKMPELNSIKDYFYNPFKEEPTDGFGKVIGDKKSALMLILEDLNLTDQIDLKTIYGPRLNQSYEYGKESVTNYIVDVMNVTGLKNISAMNIQMIVLQLPNGKEYVVKGESELKVINDFIKGDIKIAGYTYKDFREKIGSDYWREYSPVSFQLTTILSSSNNLKEHIFLLERYEEQNENILQAVKEIQTAFIF